MAAAGPFPSQAEIDEESRKVRRLRIVVNLSLSLIAQGDLPYEEAQELAAARGASPSLFPGKGDVYDLLLPAQIPPLHQRRSFNPVLQ